MTLFARFLEKLRSLPDGDGSVLDHSLIVYGGGMGNPNGHASDPLPVRGRGRWRRQGAPARSGCASRRRSATCGWRSPTSTAAGWRASATATGASRTSLRSEAAPACAVVARACARAGAARRVGVGRQQRRAPRRRPIQAGDRQAVLRAAEAAGRRERRGCRWHHAAALGGARRRPGPGDTAGPRRRQGASGQPLRRDARCRWPRSTATPR